MNLSFHPPDKRKDYYVSRITHPTKNTSFYVKVEDATVLGVHRIPNEGGYVIKLWVPPESEVNDIMAELDTRSIATSIEKNQEWFGNGLTEEKIHEYFRSSIDNNVCTVMVSPIKIPRRISVGHQEVDDFDELLAKHRNLKSMTCTCVIELQGLYFYPKKFGLKWIIRDIALYDPYGAGNAGDDVDEPEKEDIEHAWKVELEEVKDMIKDDTAKLYERVNELMDFKKSLVELLTAAKNEDSCNSTWDEKLETLKTKIFQYKSGRL